MQNDSLARHSMFTQDGAVTSGKALRQPAGTVLDNALPHKDGRSNLHRAAAIIVAGEHPELSTAARNDMRENWRKWLLRWVGGEQRTKPVNTIVQHRAETLARYFPVEAEDLTRPVPTRKELLERKAGRLQAELIKTQEQLFEAALEESAALEKDIAKREAASAKDSQRRRRAK